MKAQIQAFLPADHPWKDQIRYYQAIDSTNTEAKRIAATAPHGTVLIAEEQTGGRGRMGRSFCSPARAGIYLSVILRPNCRAEQLMHLTCAVAVAMCDAVETVSGLRPNIKWINDLLFQGKKLGGILTEMNVDPATGFVNFAVVGIGINCSQEIGDFPLELQDIAISLKTATGKDIDNCRLAAQMLNALWEMDCRLFSDKDQLMAAYRKNCVTLGQEILLLRQDTTTPCRAVDLDADGALIVEYADGTTETVTSGQVSTRNL